MAETLFCGSPCGCRLTSSTFHPGSVFESTGKACTLESKPVRKSTVANISKFQERDFGMALFTLVRATARGNRYGYPSEITVVTRFRAQVYCNPKPSA